MDNNILIAAIKPAIKPAFKRAEKQILEQRNIVQEKYFPDKNKEIHVLLSEHNNKIIISAILMDVKTQKIEIAPKEIQNDFIRVQPLMPFLLQSFDKSIKKEKK